MILIQKTRYRSVKELQDFLKMLVSFLFFSHHSLKSVNKSRGEYGYNLDIDKSISLYLYL